ncbi:MAG: hypothetical protein ACOCT9_02515 [archaeon]
MSENLTRKQREKLERLRNHVESLKNEEYQKEKKKLREEIKKYRRIKEGKKIKVMSLKVSESEELDILKRLHELRMSTSDYLRSLVKKDLINSGGIENGKE